MNQSLRIAIAEDEPRTLEFLQDAVTELGHEVVVLAKDGEELVLRCREAHPDLVITDILMPGMDGLEATHKVGSEEPIPVIVVSAHHDSELIERALDNHVLAYLVKPIREGELKTAIALVTRRFKEFQALQQQADDLRQALEDRKVVERAKGIIMKRAGLDEQDAFSQLQKLASNKNTKMVEIARMIVTAEQAFQS